MVGGPAPASGKSHRSVDGDLRLSCTDLAAHSEELTLEGASQAPVEGLYHPRTREPHQRGRGVTCTHMR